MTQQNALLVQTVGMGRYRYQIFDTVDTGLRSDGIDTRKQYRRVSIHARAALRMRKVYVSTRSREISGGDSGGDWIFLSDCLN